MANSVEIKQQDALDRIAGSLEKIAEAQDSERLRGENAELRAKVEALAATLHVAGENIGAIFEDESLDLMGRHAALRKLGEQMVKLAGQHQPQAAPHDMEPPAP